MTHLWKQLMTGSLSLKLATVVLVLIWVPALGVVGVALTLMMESAGQAQLPTIESNAPTIFLEPTTGSFDTVITVQGQDWQPGHTVMIYAVDPADIDITGYALASAEVDSDGQFAAILMLPSNSTLATEEQIKVIARDSAGGVTVQALFSLVNSPAAPAEPLEEPTLIIPTSVPTTAIQPPTSTSQPLIALAAATADVNIRSGPGTAYAILGLLRAGQNAEVTGLSPDGNWWQINFSGASDGRGWVSARYVATQNTANVPVAQAPSLPQQPQAVLFTPRECVGLAPTAHHHSLIVDGAGHSPGPDCRRELDGSISAGLRVPNACLLPALVGDVPTDHLALIVDVRRGTRIGVDHDSAPSLTPHEGAWPLRATDGADNVTVAVGACSVAGHLRDLRTGYRHQGRAHARCRT